MHKILCLFGSAALVALGALPSRPVSAGSGGGELDALSWLAGEWRGKAGGADVVSWHSDPAGGMILMATKELEGGKLSLFDFGVVTEKHDQVAYVPYPYGKPSVAFLLSDFDPKLEKAVFANEDHDFPKRFIFERKSTGRLHITLTGDERGVPTTVEYELARAQYPAPANSAPVKK